MIKGLVVIRTIQSTDRFDAFEAEYKGQKVFAKKAKADKPRELLARVPENSKVANRLGQKTDFKFRAPDVIKQENDWLVTEWVKGQSLATNAANDGKEVADVLVNFLLVFDHEPVINGEVRKTFKSQSLTDYMAEKLPKKLNAQQREIIAQAKARFDELQKTLTPSWQDGDIRPDHIFADTKLPGGYVLIDPEHLDPHWPRFYSLANNFVKYRIRGPQEVAVYLVESFLDKLGISEDVFFQPFLANVIVRGISLHWEPEYEPGGQEYNTPRAQELLKACLCAKNLDDLLVFPR